MRPKRHEHLLKFRYRHLVNHLSAAGNVLSLGLNAIPNIDGFTTPHDFVSFTTKLAIILLPFSITTQNHSHLLHQLSLFLQQLKIIEATNQL